MPNSIYVYAFNGQDTDVIDIFANADTDVLDVSADVGGDDEVAALAVPEEDRPLLSADLGLLGVTADVDLGGDFL